MIEVIQACRLLFRIFVATNLTPSQIFLSPPLSLTLSWMNLSPKPHNPHFNCLLNIYFGKNCEKNVSQNKSLAELSEGQDYNYNRPYL